MRRQPNTAESFVENVIVCHHARPKTKRRGLHNLLSAGHTVSLASSIDGLTIDGCAASWRVLEEWAQRTR